MALDQNAGKKKAVGLARNLFGAEPEKTETNLNQTVASAITVETPSIVANMASRNSISAEAGKGATPQIATQSNRNRKISFLTDSKLEERFKKARLKGGFHKLEDAYNEALKRFCDQVDNGDINF